MQLPNYYELACQRFVKSILMEYSRCIIVTQIRNRLEFVSGLLLDQILFLAVCISFRVGA